MEIFSSLALGFVSLFSFLGSDIISTQGNIFTQLMQSFRSENIDSPTTPAKESSSPTTPSVTPPQRGSSGEVKTPAIPRPASTQDRYEALMDQFRGNPTSPAPAKTPAPASPSSSEFGGGRDASHCKDLPQNARWWGDGTWKKKGSMFAQYTPQDRPDLDCDYTCKSGYDYISGQCSLAFEDEGGSPHVCSGDLPPNAVWWGSGSVARPSWDQGSKMALYRSYNDPFQDCDFRCSSDYEWKGKKCEKILQGDPETVGTHPSQNPSRSPLAEEQNITFCQGNLPSNTAWWGDEKYYGNGQKSAHFQNTDNPDQDCDFGCIDGYRWNNIFKRCIWVGISSSTPEKKPSLDPSTPQEDPIIQICEGRLPENAKWWNDGKYYGKGKSSVYYSKKRPQEKDCAFECISGYDWNAQKNKCEFICRGELPENAQWWNGNVWKGKGSKVAVYTSTDQKNQDCDYACVKGYTPEPVDLGRYVGLDENRQQLIQELFKCIPDKDGDKEPSQNAPATSKRCEGDLPENTQWWSGAGSYKDALSYSGRRKAHYEGKNDPQSTCDFHCVSGYEWSGEACLPPQGEISRGEEALAGTSDSSKKDNLLERFKDVLADPKKADVREERRENCQGGLPVGAFWWGDSRWNGRGQMQAHYQEKDNAKEDCDFGCKDEYLWDAKKKQCQKKEIPEADLPLDVDLSPREHLDDAQRVRSCQGLPRYAHWWNDGQWQGRGSLYAVYQSFDNIKEDCDYRCIPGYKWDSFEEECVKEAPLKVEEGAQDMTCQGSLPQNARWWGDEKYYGKGKPSAHYNSFDAPSQDCDFFCEEGFKWEKGECQKILQQCQGRLPNNAVPWARNAFWKGQGSPKFVYREEDDLKEDCDFTCPWGFVWDGSECRPSGGVKKPSLTPPQKPALSPSLQPPLLDPLSGPSRGVLPPQDPGNIMCTMQYDPVCGIDGKTYSNDCVAEQSGVLFYRKGECR